MIDRNAPGLARTKSEARNSSRRMRRRRGGIFRCHSGDISSQENNLVAGKRCLICFPASSPFSCGLRYPVLRSPASVHASCRSAPDRYPAIPQPQTRGSSKFLQVPPASVVVGDDSLAYGVFHVAFRYLWNWASSRDRSRSGRYCG